MAASSLPISVLADSYKAAHFAQYPEANRMVAYGEFRAPMKGLDDDRVVFYGMRYMYESILARQWTQQDVDQADLFYKTHNAGFTPYPFPRDLFSKFVKENNGYFPVKIEAIQDGSVIYPHVPVYQITAEKEYSRLVTFLETVLTMVWYPTTVATLSRRAKHIIGKAFDKSVDPENMWALDSRLHDFGFRGCTTVEQSTLGGCAHLLNFRGSDTMSACYYAQFTLNEGRPIAQSIPATEHSVMTSWPNERKAIQNMIEKFGDGVFACVMDSYDYTNALDNVLPSLVKEKEAKKGYMVLRPDSGDPIEAVMQGLRAAEKAFGAEANKKGFKVIKGAGVIQGDGIDIAVLEQILNAVLDAGYSAQSVAFGMGGGLLQKVNRDTMSFATKLAFIEYADGTQRDVMKTPKTDGGKFSLPGILAVVPNEQGVPTVYPVDPADAASGKKIEGNMLQVIYDNGPVGHKWENFDQLRARVESEWQARPAHADALSAELHKKAQDTIARVRATM
eukprot:TRINITY_DN6007_c0_g1_i1.p2 TRINITY_DN6007_c0_g1~~TRINITY_DN6007_c0_g1_i1.p2  ORF type:complete len:516 (+),score=106.80 TRINITY_DN6007_c0_g1_i1:34-1548(+)